MDQTLFIALISTAATIVAALIGLLGVYYGARVARLTATQQVESSAVVEARHHDLEGDRFVVSSALELATALREEVRTLRTKIVELETEHALEIARLTAAHQQEVNSLRRYAESLRRA